ncbi:ATP-binding protein [Sulfobacillus thermosulfidooxidans]|uniref:ATP-binding protein n=1 Tax=Sulfobacillus thermosulfidooxidans TaxID=28034 RepID=UPI0006B4B23B|nr:ATP-binding protein [Sulfobacillus thermosulfidooxidans]
MMEPSLTVASPMSPSSLLGRHEEWALLNTLTDFSHPKRPIVYLFGPSGSGKSHVAEQFFEYQRHCGKRALYSQARLIGQNEQDITRYVQQVFEFEPADKKCEWSQLAFKARDLIWIIDDYDEWRRHQLWFWPVLTDMRHLGACIVLTGKEAPQRLWAGQSEHVLETLPLADFDKETMLEICRQFELHDPDLVSEAMAISRGRPRLLYAMAQGIKLVKDMLPPESHLNANLFHTQLPMFLIEQVCHPGSRRMRWRAGQGSHQSFDLLMAAASLTPIFTRELLNQLIGHNAVNESWDEFTNSPFLDVFQGGYFGLYKGLRQRIRHATQQARPWIWEQWTRKTAHYFINLVETTENSFPFVWEQLVGLIRWKLGHSAFEVDTWQEQEWQIIHESDLNTQENTESFSVIDEQKRRLGTLTFFRSHPEPKLVITGIVSHDNNMAVPFMLFSHVIKHSVQYPKIVWALTPQHPMTSSFHALLHYLGFIDHADGSQILDYSQGSVIPWLQRILRSPQGEPLEDPVQTVQNALQVLSSDIALNETNLSRYWQSIAHKGTLRTWFLDALSSADLGSNIGGRTLLVLYYLKKQGTHEELAEHLHLSRATYFRNHRTALEKLSAALFD